LKINRGLFEKVKAELQAKGTLAAAIEEDQSGKWLGVIFEKDLSFSDIKDQVHFANCVFDGNKRI
jgi:hypothetical protein